MTNAADDVLDIPTDLKRDSTNTSPAMTVPHKPKDEKAKKPAVEKKPAVAKKSDVKKPEALSGTFKLIDWAKDVKLDPRHVRRVARSIKPQLAKLYVNDMKYVFADKNRDAVARMINEGLASETKPAPVVKKARKVAKKAVKSSGKKKGKR